MLFRKNKYNTRILAPNEKKFGTIMREAYSTNPISKKSADTILTRLLTTSGNDVVSAMNPLAMIKGKTIYFQAGAGIVADSDPEREYWETVNKAKAMAKAIEMAGEGLI